MVARRNIRESEFRKMQGAMKVQQTAAPMNAASISYGRTRWIGGQLKGEAGAEGDWEGPWSNTGPFSNYGPFYNEGTFRNVGPLLQEGPSRFTGGVDIEGFARLLNDLLVAVGGSITVEDGEIRVLGPIGMKLKDGVIDWDNGAQLRGSPDGATLDSGTAQVQVSTTVASISSGTNSFRSEGTGNVVEGATDMQDDLLLNGRLFGDGISQAPIAGVPSGTLVRDPSSRQIYAAI